MQVESHAAPNFNASGHKRFSFLSPESEKPLTQKLLALIRSEMEKKGFVHDDRNPNILVAVKAGITTEKKRRRIPGQRYAPELSGRTEQIPRDPQASRIRMTSAFTILYPIGVPVSSCDSGSSG
ncbi:MAG: DUF4136 domain-containing protein [Smithella sp.]|nr:DUF4136 domain-containing protein [Smithella sp.]